MPCAERPCNLCLLENDVKVWVPWLDSSSEGPHNKISIYCKTISWECSLQAKSCERTCPKGWGWSLNSLGNTFHIGWKACSWGSSKAKWNWEPGCKGIQKNASFQSVTIHHSASSGIWDKRVYGLGTIGCIGTTASLSNKISWTNLHFLLAFWTPRIGVLEGRLQNLRDYYKI